MIVIVSVNIPLIDRNVFGYSFDYNWMIGTRIRCRETCYLTSIFLFIGTKTFYNFQKASTYVPSK